MAEAFNFYFAIIEHDWKLTKKATGLDNFTENINYSLTILLELYWIILALGRLNTVQHDPCAWLERGSWFFIMIFSPKLTRCWIQSSRLIVPFWVMQIISGIRKVLLVNSQNFTSRGFWFLFRIWYQISMTSCSLATAYNQK